MKINNHILPEVSRWIIPKVKAEEIQLILEIGKTHDFLIINSVRNSSGALAAQALAQRVKPRRNYLECNPAAEQRGIISNGVKRPLRLSYSGSSLDRICWPRMSLGDIIKFKNLTTFAISLDAKQDITFRISIFPTGPFWIEISRAIYMYVF